MPWVSRGEFRRLLRQLAHAEERALDAEQRLEAERTANRRSERHWANMFLRSKAIGAYPEQPIEQPVAAEVLSAYDPGELAAQVEEGAHMGIPRAEVIARFFEYKGIPVPAELVT